MNVSYRVPIGVTAMTALGRDLPATAKIWLAPLGLLLTEPGQNPVLE